MKNNVIALVTQINDVKELNNLLKDASDFAGTLSTTFELGKNVYLFYKRKNFEAFTIELFKKLHSNESDANIDSEQLNKYFNNSTNLEHMSQIIDTSLHSHSIKCSAILGHYAGGLLSQRILLEYKDTIVVNALKIMNDRDLNNFIKLFKFVKSRPDLMEKHNKQQLRTHDIQTDLAELNIPIFELELTIEKLKSVQGIGYDIGGWGSVGNAWGTFKFNENSDYLFKLISKFEDIVCLP